MIYIIPDSNFIYTPYEKCADAIYDNFALGGCFKDMLSLQDENCVCILIPEIVVKELMEQKIEQFKKDTYDYNKIAKRLGLKVEEVQQVDTLRAKQQEKMNDYLNDHKVELIPICNNTYWENIIQKAVKKEPPFEGKDGKADKGFKDTVIYYSVLDYAKNHLGTYYLLSKDTIWSKKNTSVLGNLKTEFTQKTNGSTLMFFDDFGELKRRIQSYTLNSVDVSFRMNEEFFCWNNMLERVPIKIKKIIPIFTAQNEMTKLLTEQIDYIYAKYMSFWNEYKDDKYDDEPEMEYEGVFKVDFFKSQNQCVSLRFVQYMYIGGAHGGTDVTAYTYDLKTGEFLSLKKLFQWDEQVLLKRINDAILKDMQSCDEGKYYDDETYLDNIDDIVFYVKESEVHVVFNEYELGPYASGTIDLVIGKIDET